MTSVRSDVPFVTPTGWSLAGELRPGDQVFDHQGQVTMVTELSFEDVLVAVEAKMVLEPVTVSLDHDIVVGLPWYGRQWAGSLADLAERSRRLADPLAPVKRVSLKLEPAELPGRQLPGAELSAWAYGYWRVLELPEGTIAVQLPLMDRAVGLLEAAGLAVKTTFIDRDLAYLTSPTLGDAIMELGDWPGFHPAYLRADEATRRELIAGVTDARGRFMNGVTIEAPRPIVTQVAELAMTLGLRASMPNKGLPRVRMSPHDAAMILRAQELEDFLTGPNRPGYRTEVPYMIRRARRVEGGDFVRVQTQAGTYLVGRAMLPARDH